METMVVASLGDNGHGGSGRGKHDLARRREWHQDDGGVAGSSGKKMARLVAWMIAWWLRAA